MITKIIWKNRPHAIAILARAYIMHWQNNDVDLDIMANQLMQKYCAFAMSSTGRASNKSRMLCRLHHDALTEAHHLAGDKS